MMVIVPRIAAVSYLNTIPFIYGIGHEGNLRAELLLSPPAVCAKNFAEHKADIALVPAAAVPSLWVMLTTIVPCVPAFIYQFSVSGTGNTRTALGITLVCVTAYTLYTLWLVYVLRADVALCWTADHVYYLISLALSYAYIRSGRWRRLKI